jgi:hypothetical protein
MLGSGIFDSNLGAQFAAANRMPTAFTLAESFMKPFAGLDLWSSDWAKIANVGFNPTANAIDLFAKSMMASVSRVDGISLHKLFADRDVTGLQAMVSKLDTSVLGGFAKVPDWVKAAQGADGLAAMAFKLDNSTLNALSKVPDWAKAAQGVDGLTAMAFKADGFVNSKNLSSWLYSQAFFAGDMHNAAASLSALVGRLDELSMLQNSAFLGFRSQLQAFQHLPVNWIAKNSNAQRAFGSLYTQLAAKATVTSQWTELGIGAELGREVFAFGDELASEGHLSRESLTVLFELATRIYSLLILIPDKAAALQKVLLHLLGTAWDMLTIGSVIKDSVDQIVTNNSTDSATKKDLQDVGEEIAVQHQNATQILAEKKEAHTVVREVEVYLKPKANSLITGKLSPNTIVVVIQSCTQWGYVRFQDTDGEPAHGWLLKKYLGKI